MLIYMLNFITNTAVGKGKRSSFFSVEVGLTPGNVKLIGGFTSKRRQIP